ncbi:hypothetical protein BBJ28_00003512 [Nothophytophthora sp. Chile5]|nr:hypothetical protein BBJ28_00003512 [Nothophytophthora sp. Chile5]
MVVVLVVKRVGALPVGPPAGKLVKDGVVGTFVASVPVDMVVIIVSFPELLLDSLSQATSAAEAFPVILVAGTTGAGVPLNEVLRERFPNRASMPQPVRGAAGFLQEAYSKGRGVTQAESEHSPPQEEVLRDRSLTAIQAEYREATLRATDLRIEYDAGRRAEASRLGRRESVGENCSVDPQDSAPVLTYLILGDPLEDATVILLVPEERSVGLFPRDGNGNAIDWNGNTTYRNGTLDHPRAMGAFTRIIWGFMSTVTRAGFAENAVTEEQGCMLVQ